MAHISKGTKSE